MKYPKRPISQRNLLKPHTSEWYDRLMPESTEQAMHTMAVVAAAGHDYVCSVCGDGPTKDYCVDETHCTIRLCGDCLRIRSDKKGDIAETYYEVFFE